MGLAWLPAVGTKIAFALQDMLELLPDRMPVAPEA